LYEEMLAILMVPGKVYVKGIDVGCLIAFF
jgi:uncharacterized membrane protein